MGRSTPISEFCLRYCPFNKEENLCKCIDDKFMCPVDHFIKYLTEWGYKN